LEETTPPVSTLSKPNNNISGSITSRISGSATQNISGN